MLSIVSPAEIEVRHTVAGMPLMFTMRLLSEYEAWGDQVEALSSAAMDVMNAVADMGRAATPEAMADARKRAAELMALNPEWKDQTIRIQRRKAQRLAEIVTAIRHADTGEDVELPTAEQYEHPPFSLHFLKELFEAYALEVASRQGKSSTPSTLTPTAPAKRRAGAGSGTAPRKPRRGAA